MSYIARWRIPSTKINPVQSFAYRVRSGDVADDKRGFYHRVLDGIQWICGSQDRGIPLVRRHGVHLWEKPLLNQNLVDVCLIELYAPSATRISPLTAVPSVNRSQSYIGPG